MKTKYAKSHEWIKILNESEALVGISDHAQESLGDITFVELPPVGTKFSAGQTFGVVESVKAASDVYMPVSGTIIAVNEKLSDSPELVNSDPEGESWLIKIEPDNASDADSLLDLDAYLASI